MLRSSTKQEQPSSKDTGSQQGQRCGDSTSTQTTRQRKHTMQQPITRVQTHMSSNLTSNHKGILTSNHKGSKCPRQQHLQYPPRNPPPGAHHTNPPNTTTEHMTYRPPKTSLNTYTARRGHQSSHPSYELSKQATIAHSRDLASKMWQDTAPPMQPPPSWDTKCKSKRGSDQTNGPPQQMHYLPGESLPI